MSLLNVSKGFSSAHTSRQFFASTNVKQQVLSTAGQVANGGNLKDVKARIKSVGSIKKITKTMNMISTARLKQVQARMEKARVFYQTVSPILDLFPTPTKVENSLVIPIAADRGLCGAINTSVAKAVKALTKEGEKAGETVQIQCVGEKVPGQLAREYGNKILATYTEISKRPFTFAVASSIGERAFAANYDIAKIVFNKFNSVISYTTTTQTFGSPKSILNNASVFEQFDFEDEDSLHHIPDVVEYATVAAIFRAYLEGSTAELGGRMSSMDNATRNAGEMIKKLTVMYNRKRQAAITTELTEIISGASAVKA